MAIFKFLQWFYEFLTGKKAPAVSAACPVSQPVNPENPTELEKVKKLE
jgi:hypothetical protein